MQTEQVIDACNKHVTTFRKHLEGETFQLRGVFNSEALLLVSVTKELAVKRFIESGRARGHSTNLVAKNLSDSNTKIYSIDVDAHSNDAKYSHQVLSKFDNVSLIYGDANHLLPDLISEDCVVFIDGPKGDEAIVLAIKALENSHVKAVAIHDLHKNTYHRTICESVFSNCFFSDNEAFVAAFSALDDDCWKVLEGTGEAPYQRYGKPIASYASTLGVFFNSEEPFDDLQKRNYLSYLNLHSPSLKSVVAKRFPYAGKLRRALRTVGI